MLALWVVIGSTSLLLACALWVTVRRTRDEVTPTVRAFEEFRAALRPAIAGLDEERRALAATLADRRHGPAR